MRNCAVIPINFKRMCILLKRLLPTCIINVKLPLFLSYSQSRMCISYVESVFY